MPFNPRTRREALFGPFPLIIPLDLAFEREPAVLHDRADTVPLQLALDACQRIASDLQIRSFVDIG
jgi:hypothetical protein